MDRSSLHRSMPSTHRPMHVPISVLRILEVATDYSRELLQVKASLFPEGHRLRQKTGGCTFRYMDSSCLLELVGEKYEK